MKTKTLRTLTALAVIVIIGVGFVTNTGIGTVSAIGWDEFSLLCPLGALGTMLASKMMVPRAVISLIFALLFIVVFARAFCGWLCPVPIVQKVRGLFAKKPSKDDAARQLTPNSELSENTTVALSEGEKTEEAVTPTEASTAPAAVAAPLTEKERKALSSSCSGCAEKRGKALDARHFVLGGSLLSAAVFGFPVFCLICPIGLSFATILLVIRLFSGGDVTLSLLVVPVILIVEVVLFKKWCHKLCPLSALMSLVGKANRTFKPTIDDATCIETARGRTCGVCAKVCPEGIDPRHPENGSAWSECTKCRACVDACPTKSITMPLLPKKSSKNKEQGELVGTGKTPIPQESASLTVETKS